MLTNRPTKKHKKCRICKEWFLPFKEMQPVCTKIECIIESGKRLKTKREKEAKAKREISLKQKLGKDFQKNKKSPLVLAQEAFNAYIRERDKGKNCISCQRPYGELKKVNAGHFKSVGGNNSLRFNLWNCHLQCEYCNTYKNGNLTKYIENLIEKIGIEKVEFLESQQKTRKFSKEYLERLIRIFREKTKRLKNNKLGKNNEN